MVWFTTEKTVHISYPRLMFVWSVTSTAFFHPPWNKEMNGDIKVARAMFTSIGAGSFTLLMHEKCTPLALFKVCVLLLTDNTPPRLIEGFKRMRPSIDWWYTVLFMRTEVISFDTKHNSCWGHENCIARDSKCCNYDTPQPGPSMACYSNHKNNWLGLLGFSGSCGVFSGG